MLRWLKNRVSSLLGASTPDGGSRQGPPAPHNLPVTLYKTRHGNYYLPDGNTTDIVISQMKRGEIFEPEIVDLGRRFIKPGTTALDVGSCFGQMALMFSDFVGPTGDVLAFEADEYVAGILQKNVAANEKTNIRVFQRAVHERNDETVYYPVPDFARFGSYGSYGIDPRAKEGRQVSTMTIDSLQWSKPISFMKVDVQGSDLFVLRGATETIRRHQMPIVFEFEEQFQAEFGTSLKDYLAFIESVSYKILEVIRGINYVIVPKSK